MLVPVTDFHLKVCIVRQQLGHPTTKGKDHKKKEKHPLDDVDDHFAESDLEWPQVGVDREEISHLWKKDFIGLEFLARVNMWTMTWFLTGWVTTGY